MGKRMFQLLCDQAKRAAVAVPLVPSVSIELSNKRKHPIIHLIYMLPQSERTLRVPSHICELQLANLWELKRKM